MADASAHLDLDALNELKQIMGEEYALLMETFVNDSTMRLKAIKAAVAARDADAIRRSAHSFKGSAANMGAFRLTQLCKSLEELGASGGADGSDSLLKEMQLEYQQVALALART